MTGKKPQLKGTKTPLHFEWDKMSKSKLNGKDPEVIHDFDY